MLNIIDKLKSNITLDKTDEQIEEIVHVMLNEFDRVYSYLVYRRSNEWQVEINLSQTDSYNTIGVLDAYTHIVALVQGSRYSQPCVVGYGQPPLELAIEIYKPLVHKMVTRQCSCWRQLEYEDAYQTAMYVMTKLYRRGYYINKRLFERAFVNQILMDLRVDRDKPTLCNIDQLLSPGDGEDKDSKLGDTLVDLNELLDAEERELHEFNKQVFNDIKDILIDYIGQRQFDQLYNEYANKSSSAWSRKKMQTIRNYMARQGYKLEDWYK